MHNTKSIIGCPHIFLLTKCDKVSNSLKTGRRRIFDDGNVRGCKDELMTEFNLKQQQIYPIINYDDQNDVDKHIDRLILGMYVFFPHMSWLRVGFYNH
jgi:hypothetical protein